MCFSAGASLTAGALLVPAGLFNTRRAFRLDRRYVLLAALPLLFGLQQLFEALIWIGGKNGDQEAVDRYAMAYMFFAWMVWPVWVPVSTFLLEPARRKPLYLVFIVAGSMLGALQYVPYFAHSGWLETRLLPRAISYGGTELLDFVTGRGVTYLIYVALILLPLLLSSDRRVRVFGVLVATVLVVTYTFFRYAYVSVFCFGGALMSFYLLALLHTGRPRAGSPPSAPPPPAASVEKGMMGKG